MVRYGQLGDGTTINRLMPTQAKLSFPILAIATGDAHCLAKKSDGTVWGWGHTGGGQLAESSNPLQFGATVGNNGVTLFWKAISSDFKSFQVRRGKVPFPPENLGPPLSSSVLSYTDTTVAPKTHYKYDLVGTTTAGDLIYFNRVDVTTP